MAQPPSFPFYPGDWLLGTLTFTLAEDGAYLRLVMHQWSSGSVPGDDMAAVARILRVSEREARVLWSTVSAKFVRGDDGLWRNVRLEKQRDEKVRYHEAKRANGRKGGRPKQNRDETGGKPIGSVSPNRNESLSLSLSPVPNGTENARVRTRPGDPHGQRLDANVATRIVGAEGQLIDVPAGWAQKACREHGITLDQIDQFATWAGAWIRRSGYAPPGGNKLAWLDARLADWRAERLRPNDGYRSGRELIAAMDAESAAIAAAATPEEVRAALHAGRRRAGR